VPTGGGRGLGGEFPVELYENGAGDVAGQELLMTARAPEAPPDVQQPERCARPAQGLKFLDIDKDA
jgi:hypothetical protein